MDLFSFLRKMHPRGNVCCDMFKYPNFLLHFLFYFFFSLEFSIKQNQYYVMSKMRTNDDRSSSIDLCNTCLYE